jgi:hypothetical protein
MDWDDYPVILGFGSTHEMRDAEEVQRSRLWGLKSTSRAACIAMDKQKDHKPRKVGFLARRPR